MKFTKMPSFEIFVKLKAVLAIALLFAVDSPLAADKGIYHLSPAGENVKGFAMPRNDLTLYRGIDANQAPLKRVIKAMLGDPLSNIESAMFYTIKQGLMKKSQSLLNFVPPRGRSLKDKYYEMGFQKEIDNAISRNNGAPYSEKEAIDLTKSILATAYTDSYVIKSIVDYKEPDRDDFPPAFLYSSIYIEVAKIYSSNILIYDESQRKRSLDQNYWNWKYRNQWVCTVNNMFPDRAEFLTPFYIPYDQITGYQWHRSSFNKNDLWYEWRDLKNDLTLVFMKAGDPQNPIIYVFDGSGLSHIVKDGKSFCSAQSQFNPNSEFPSLPLIDCKTKPKLVTVLKMCSENKNINECGVDDSYFREYQSSQKYLDSIKELLDINFNGAKLVSCTSSTDCKSL